MLSQQHDTAHNKPGPSGSVSVIHSIASKFGIIAINAATGILTARALRPEGRGELAAMIIWSLFLANGTTLGIPSSLIYFFKRRPELKRQFTTSSLVFSFSVGIVAAAAGACFLPLWLHQYSPTMIRSAQWFLLFTPICAITLTGRALLEGSDQFSMSNTVQALTPGVTLVALLCFAFAQRLTSFTAGIAYVFACIPTCVMLLLKVNLDWIRPRFFSISACRLLLGYGIRSYGIDLLGTLALQVDQVLVVNLLTPSAMGSYVVILSLSRMLNLFQNSVVMVLFPKAAGKQASEVLQLTERAARVSTSITMLCGVGICLLGPFLLKLLYGKEYVGAVNALRILIVEVTLSGLVFVLAQAFMAVGRPGIVTILQAIGLGCSVPIMFILVPKLGVLGAAIALLISTIVRLILVLLAFPVVLNLSFPHLVPLPTDFTDLVSRFTHAPESGHLIK